MYVANYKETSTQESKFTGPPHSWSRMVLVCCHTLLVRFLYAGLFPNSETL